MNNDNQGITPKEKINMGTAHSFDMPHYDPIKDIYSDSPDFPLTLPQLCSLMLEFSSFAKTYNFDDSIGSFAKWLQKKLTLKESQS